MLRIKTTKQIQNTVVLDYSSYLLYPENAITFWCNKRQASDLLLKICFNPIFCKLNDISMRIIDGTYIIDITTKTEFTIDADEVLE